jgi:hypothetical protein
MVFHHVLYATGTYLLYKAHIVDWDSQILGFKHATSLEAIAYDAFYPRCILAVLIRHLDTQAYLPILTWGLPVCTLG